MSNTTKPAEKGGKRNLLRSNGGYLRVIWTVGLKQTVNEFQNLSGNGNDGLFPPKPALMRPEPGAKA